MKNRRNFLNIIAMGFAYFGVTPSFLKASQIDNSTCPSPRDDYLKELTRLYPNGDTDGRHFGFGFDEKKKTCYLTTEYIFRNRKWLGIPIKNG